MEKDVLDESCIKKCCLIFPKLKGFENSVIKQGIVDALLCDVNVNDGLIPKANQCLPFFKVCLFTNLQI